MKRDPAGQTIEERLDALEVKDDRTLVFRLKKPFAGLPAALSKVQPTPAIMPAACTSPSYMPKAASGAISRNGEPGSSNDSTRWRGAILPRATWRARAASGPPSAAAARRSSNSSFNAAQAAWFSLAPGAASSWLVVSGGTAFLP